MLNLTQRLILGCVLLVCLTLGLVAATHQGLAAAGQLNLGYAFLVAALLIAAATVFFVLGPIRTLAREQPGRFWRACQRAEPDRCKAAGTARLRSGAKANGVSAFGRSASVDL